MTYRLIVAGVTVARGFPTPEAADGARYGLVEPEDWAVTRVTEDDWPTLFEVDDEGENDAR